MKNLKKKSKDDYTLFQDIMDAYRYPDGTLNRIAILISTLALVLLLTLAHFTVSGIKTLKSMNTVSASELTIDEIEDYITQSYLEAISEYSGGDIDQEAIKNKILSLLTNYIESSNGFTTQQNEALKEILSEYLATTTIYSDIEKNTLEIKSITSLIDRKFSENQQYADEIKSYLENEIIVNTNISEDNYANLTEEIEKLKTYIDSRKTENVPDIDSLLEEVRNTYVNAIGDTEYNKNAISNLENIINNLEQSTNAEMQDLYVILYNSILDAYNELMESLTNQENEFNNSLEQQSKNINNTITQQGEEFNQSIAEQGEELNQTITQQREEFNQSITQQREELNQAITQQLEAIKQLISQNEENIYQTINQQNDSLTQSINQQGDSFNQALSQQGDNFKQSLNEQSNSFNEALTQQGDIFNQSLSEQYNNFNQSLTEQSNSSTNALNDLQEQIDAINSRLEDNGSYFKFGYDSNSGAYGYYVNGELKPW